MNSEDKILNKKGEIQGELFNNDSAYDLRPRTTISKKMGRPRGKPNLSTREIKERIRKVIALVPPEQTILDLMNMSPSERQRTLIAYMEFAVPKPQRMIVERGDGEENDMIIVLPGEIMSEIGVIEDKKPEIGEETDSEVIESTDNQVDSS